MQLREKLPLSSYKIASENGKRCAKKREEHMIIYELQKDNFVSYDALQNRLRDR